MTQSIGRKVSILLSGSVLAQALPVLAAPLLTRIYTPESFGQFGIFTAAATILAALANLKYDQAVLLAKRQTTAVHLLVLCTASSAVLALLLAAFAWLAPASWRQTAGFGTDIFFVACLPVSFMLAASTQSLCSMLFRHELFSTVAKARVIQALTTTSLCLGLGMLSATGRVLILATLVGQSVGIITLVLMRPKNPSARVVVRGRLLLACIRRYRRFPMFTAPSDVLNALGANLPVLFIGSIYGVGAAGAFAMAQRVLGTPLMLVGSAFSDAYRQAAAKNSVNNESYWPVAYRTLRTLGLLAIVPAIVCILFADTLFPLIFGSKWALSGMTIQVLGFVYFLRFAVSPLSYNYYLAERHSEDLMLQCASFALTVAIFLYAQSHAVEFITALALYTAVYFSVYTIYGVRSMYFARMSLYKNIHRSDAVVTAQ